MLGLIGKFLGKVSLQSLSPQPNFFTQINPIRGFATKKIGANAFIGDKRNILDYHRRQLAEKYELRRNLYKAMCRDTDLPRAMREKARYKLSKLPRNSSFTRLRNRCTFTGRPRGVYQEFKMSRIVFRELANKGELEGVQKASW